MNGTDAASYWVPVGVAGGLPRLKAGKAVHYVLAGVEPARWGRRRIDLARVALGYQTTAVLAVQVALYFGFTDIRLLGFDHDWLATPDYSRHFYSSEKDEEDKLGTMSYLQILRAVTRMWEGYYALQRAAEAHGARISNWTDGSFLDVFDNESSFKRRGYQ
jgi:hypothetical protein